MPSEFQRLFQSQIENRLHELEAKSQRRTPAEIQGVNCLDAARAQNPVSGSAGATVTAVAGRA